MPDSFDYLPQPKLGYLTHKNGRGHLYELSEAHNSYVDRDSVVTDEGSIWRSKVTRSLIRGSLVSDAVIEHSSILFTDIHGAVIRDSVIACEFVGQNARISGCEITGKSKVSAAVCENVRFSNLTVTGAQTVLRDWPAEVVEGAHGYITRGVWTSPPRIFRISPNITLTEGVPGFAFVHCHEYEIKHLLKIGRRLGRQARWTADEVLAVRRVLHHLQKITPY